MKLYMFVKCNNAATIPVDVDIGMPVIFDCPFPTDNEYCEYKPNCKFVGVFQTKQWIENGIAFTPYSFIGTRQRNGHSEEWNCPAIGQEEFLEDLIRATGAKRVIFMEE